MSREAVIVPEKKEKLEKIKRKYNNMQMSDETAKKISQLEVANGILKAATVGVGIAAVVDWVILDPVPGVDEAVFTGATALLGTASSVVNNKINDLASTGNAQLQMEEVTQLSNQLGDMAKKVKSAKDARQVLS